MIPKDNGMQGRIIKGVAGEYEVFTHDGVYVCKPKGIFRKNHIKPLIGDEVDIEILSSTDKTGIIGEIFERRNELIRPNVSNVDEALIVFALSSPEPNFVTLDKMILQYRFQDIPVNICFNKDDLVSDDYIEKILSEYRDFGGRVLITSARNCAGTDEVKALLKGKTTTVAGPSGVGKSSLINCLCDREVSQVGDISEKLLRGKHTTRHSEILPIDENTYIIDTPGFSSFDLFDIKAENAGDYYDEFKDCSACRFMPCSHTHEPDCSVKAAVECGRISKMRYENYVHIYDDLIKARRY